MAEPLRIRRSLQWLSQRENIKEMDKVIRAFRGIQKLDPDNWHSFFKIAGYHGEPFDKGASSGWGGYCFHGCVLFPTWHRAYCLRIEDALRTIPGCEDVALPYWDEYAEVDSAEPVISILTSEVYVLDGEVIPNPLRSYRLQVALADPKVKYSKDTDYHTVRFPLSGLVGTTEDNQKTKEWNAKELWNTADKATQKLNWNIRNWFQGKVELAPHKGENIRMTDTYSTKARLERCMQAPNWTVFSNKQSAIAYARAQEEKHRDFDPMDPQNPNWKDDHWVVSLEEPHNAIHLGLGGLFQKATGMKKGEEGYDADPKDYEGANGDMGCNETAAFDPIFFLHHAFIDYTMWTWQKRHHATEKLTIDPDIKAGVEIDDGDGNVAFPSGTLTMQTPLKPFTKDNKPDSEDWYTSDDVTNIEKLGYSYHEGSWDWTKKKLLAAPLNLVGLGQTPPVDRREISGSFVIRTYANVNGKPVEIACDPVLSRYKVENCKNCQNHLEVYGLVPIDKELTEVLDTEAGDNGKTRAYLSHEIQHLEGRQELTWKPERSGGFQSVEPKPSYVEW
jgi:tyrosinase